MDYHGCCQIFCLGIVCMCLFSNRPGNEYQQAFGSRPRIPRTPDPNSLKRPSSKGSITSMPPAPQFSESGPRPSSAGKSG